MIATRLAMIVLLVVLLIIRVRALWERRTKEAATSVPVVVAPPTVVHIHAEPRTRLVIEHTAETYTRAFYGPTGGALVNAAIAEADLARQLRTARLQTHARELGKRLCSPAPLRLVDDASDLYRAQSDEPGKDIVGLDAWLPETKPT